MNRNNIINVKFLFDSHKTHLGKFIRSNLKDVMYLEREGEVSQNKPEKIKNWKKEKIQKIQMEMKRYMITD